VDPEANIIFGMVTDMKMEDEVRVTIIATGLPTVDTSTLRDDGISEFLRQALGDESDLDLPPFLRTSHRLATE
jgi:cell division GTPase FtsZ